MRTIHFDLYYDGVKWIAKNDRIVVSGKTLEELDENLKLKLKDIFKNGKIKVSMELDFRKVIPHWMWQYHPYYFYRTVYLDLD